MTTAEVLLWEQVLLDGTHRSFKQYAFKITCIILLLQNLPYFMRIIVWLNYISKQASIRLCRQIFQRSSKRLDESQCFHALVLAGLAAAPLDELWQHLATTVCVLFHVQVVRSGNSGTEVELLEE